MSEILTFDNELRQVASQAAEDIQQCQTQHEVDPSKYFNVHVSRVKYKTI